MTDAHGIARDQLRAFIERIERLEEEKKTIADDIKDVYGEAKGTGFDAKILRKVIQIRKQDKDERAEQEAILDTYLAALGMIEQPGFFDDELRQPAPVDRKARAALRTSEAMGDNKAFSAELVAAGLISEEAHHENIALSDAVARKYGAGVIDPETGEILDESRRSDLGLNIQTKHEDITAAPETAEELQHPVPHATGANARSGGDGSTVRGARTEADAVTAGETAPHSPSDDGAFAEVKGRARLANADGVEPPSSGQVETPSDDDADHAAGANVGGDDVDGGVERATHLVTGEGAACALPTNGITMEYVPASGVKRLPFAHCFPELSKADYDRLEKDIAANRVQTPIIRQGDVIIDGFARYMISRLLGMSYPIQEYSGSDILLDVIEWQRASRNFTPAQEKKIAADLAKEIPHRADDIFAAFGLAEALEAAQ